MTTTKGIKEEKSMKKQERQTTETDRNDVADIKQIISKPGETAGDGSNIELRAKLSIGLQIYVPWITFPESSMTQWVQFKHHWVVGVLKRIHANGWEIFFPALNRAYTLPWKWIDIYGSNISTRSPLLSRTTYYQVTNSAQEIKETPRVEVNVGKQIYVRWDTFSESSMTYWHRFDKKLLYVRGIYTKQTAKGWKLHYPDLDWNGKPRIHIQTMKWIETHGLQSALPEGVILISEEEYGLSYSDHQGLVDEDSTIDQNSDTHWHTQEIPQQMAVANTEIEENVIKLEGFPPTQTPPGNSVGIAVLNINTLQRSKLGAAQWLYQNGLQIVALLDTRLNSNAQMFFDKCWKATNGAGAKIVFSTQLEKVSVGGQAHLLDGVWAQRLVSTWSDPSSLGILFETAYRSSEGIIRITSIYYPYGQAVEGSDSLASKLQRWLDKTRNGLSWELYIKEQLSARTRKTSVTHLIMGDFNKDEKELGAWNELDGYSNCHTAKLGGINSVSNAGKIDHIYSKGVIVRSGQSLSDRWLTVTDHKPFWVYLPDSGPKITKRKRSFYWGKVDFSNESHLNRYQENWPSQDSAKPDQVIFAHSTIAANRSRVKKPLRSIQLWTPLTGALFLWYKCLKKCNGGQHQGMQYEKYKLLIDKIHVDHGEVPWIVLTERYSLGFEECQQGRLSKQDIIKFLAATHKELHGSRRRQRWEEYKEWVARINTNSTQFFKALRPQRQQTDLTKLEINGEVETDPELIDRYIGMYFEATTKCTHTTAPSWEEIQNFDNFQKGVNPMIPQRLIRVIWLAIMSIDNGKFHQVQLGTTKEALTPTLAEYTKLLKESNRKSAGGVTGCTYEMLHHAPSAVISEIYYASLQLWQQSSCPDWWKTKMIYPLQKRVGVHTCKNIRPIVLLEVTRKLWYKLIIRKVMGNLEGADILQRNQCGFRAQSGCGDNLLQVINALEGNSQVFGSSFDIVGAFNAPPRYWLGIALRRLGITKEVTSILTQLDDNDINYVLTPHRIKNGTGYKFHTEIGTGQGDVTSPTLWTVYFDIILTALNSISSDLHYVTSDEQIHSVMDTAFADDLLSLCATQDRLQQKAELISALGGTLKFNIALDKLRTFSTQVEGTISIYDWNWNESHLDCSTNGFYKYLGSTREINGNSTTEKRIIGATVAEFLQRLHKKQPKADWCKLAINQVLIPKILYKGQFGKECGYQRKGILQTIKKTAHLPTSFPTALLSGPVEFGGLGIHQAELMIPMAKWELLQRALFGRIHASRCAADAILMRAAQASGDTFQEAWHQITMSNEGWIGELIASIDSFGGTIKIGHNMETNVLDAKIPANEGTQHLGLQYLGDIMEIRDGQLKTIQSYYLEGISASWPFYSLEHMQIYLRIGQFWTLDDQATPDIIIELAGFQQATVWAITWQRVTPTMISRTRSTHRLQYIRHGMVQIDNPQLTKKCIVHRQANKAELVYIASMEGTQRKLLPRETLDNSVTASDGSYTDFGQLLNSEQSTRSLSAVYGVTTKGEANIWRFRIPSTRRRAFSAEQLALLVAVTKCNGPIYTDCKSLLQRIQRNQPSVDPLFNILRQHKDRIFWTRSHPERYKEKKEWTPIDEAIHAADAVASDNSITTGTMMELSNLTMEAARCWAIWTPQGLLQDRLATYLAKHQLTDYVITRNKEDNNIWNPISLQLCMSAMGGTISQKGAYLKLFFGRFESDRNAPSRDICTCGCSGHFAEWITVCKRTEIIAIREDLHRELAESNLPYHMLKVIQSFLKSSDSENFRRGNWTQSQREQMELAYLTGAGNDKKLIRKWRRDINRIIKIVVNNSLKLYSVGSRTVALSIKGKSRQRTIPQYFSRTEEVPTKPVTREILPKKRKRQDTQSSLLEWLTKYPS